MAKNNNFIMMFNDIFKNLLKEEIYIFAWLYRYRHQYEDQWITMTSIDFIISMLQFKNIKLSVNPRTTQKRKIVQSKIRDILIKLQSLDYIECDVVPDIAGDKIFTVQFPINSEIHKGFEQLHYNTFDKFNCATEFTIYNYVNRHGSNGRYISDSEWEDILGVSRSKLRSIITNMNKANFIPTDDIYTPRLYKFSGTYIIGDTPRQEENEYYTRPSEEIKSKWNKWYNPNYIPVKIIVDKGVGLQKKEKTSDKPWGDSDPFKRDQEKRVTPFG